MRRTEVTLDGFMDGTGRENDNHHKHHQHCEVDDVRDDTAAKHVCRIVVPRLVRGLVRVVHGRSKLR